MTYSGEPKEEVKRAQPNYNDAMLRLAYGNNRDFTITKKSPVEQREYYHQLLAQVYDADPAFKKIVSGEMGGLGIFGPRTKAAPYNINKELGRSGEVILPDPVTLFGLEAARNNGNKIDEGVKEITKSFATIRGHDVAKANHFAEVYLYEKSLGKGHSEAMCMATAAAQVNDDVTKALGGNSSKAKAGEVGLDKVPYGHMFIMAQEGFNPKLAPDKGGLVIGYGTQNTVIDGKTVAVSKLFARGEEISPAKGYELMKPTIERKTAIAEAVIPRFNEMKQCQKDAMVSLVYNLEDGHLLRNDKPSPAAFRAEYPNMCAALDAGDFDAAAKHLVAGAGVHTQRRKFEAELFKGNVEEVSKKMADYYYEKPADSGNREAFLKKAESYNHDKQPESSAAKTTAVVNPTQIKPSQQRGESQILA